MEKSWKKVGKKIGLFFKFFFNLFFSAHHSDQMSEGAQVSKVTLCVKILKWHPLTHSLTMVRYRAARAAKNSTWDNGHFLP